MDSRHPAWDTPVAPLVVRPVDLSGGALFGILLSTTIVWPAVVIAGAIAVFGVWLLGWWYRLE